MNRQTAGYNQDDDEYEEEKDEKGIQWSNLIFLPFHPTFQLVVLTSVIIKTILGPIQSVYPIVYCWDVMNTNPILNLIKYLYLYICDPIYIIDSFLHVVHRTVTNEAMRREYLPKSELLLVLDIFSTLPLVQLVTSEACPPIQLWPNVMHFVEFIIIYRISEYFEMMTTHSYWNLGVGYTLIAIIGINCIVCFLLLLTSIGLCSNCSSGIYDWRKYVKGHKYNETDIRYTTYIYAASIVFSYVTHQQFDDTEAGTYLEIVLFTTFMVVSYMISLFVIFPKMFAEAHMWMKRICTYHPIVERIIEETQRRNPSPKAYVDVQKFYSLMWKKRGGITNIPEVISELPKYLRIDIRQDLVWPIFFHSPTFRKTSAPFKRRMCELVRLDYKLPGERFFAGPHCHTQLYYLKSGIVQLISADDGTTPLISVTSGTVFGDISFYLPPTKRKIIVRCLTYCEVLFVSRLDLLMILHAFPNDRRMVIENAKGRIKHARTLYVCKQHIRGLDRSEDEGIAWVKKRWWQISHAVSTWKRRPAKEDKKKCELPAEEAVYHCAKYIGQLVLCTDAQLQITSMFTNVKFPWIFSPQSTFEVIWHRIVMITVFLVVFVYPPNLTRLHIPLWFKFFQFGVDVVYAADIFVTLLTSTMRQENTIDNFASVMFARCKSTRFVLDFLATMWIENLVVLGGLPKFYYVCQFNRLIKIYVLFPKWDMSRNPFLDVCYKSFFIQFYFVYLMGYILYALDWFLPDLTTRFFFGEIFCKPSDPPEVCHADKSFFLEVFLAWMLEYLYYEYLPETLLDLYIVMIVAYFSFLVYTYCHTNIIAALYLKYRGVANFQYFVSNVNKHYENYITHPGLLKRMHRYLICHWKFCKGMDVMDPEILKNEPYDIWFKVHGEIAENIIKNSTAFAFAEPGLIKELAYRAKFLILPKDSTIFLFGLQCKTVVWSVQGHIKCEYHNDKGEFLTWFFNPGELLSTPSAFLGSPALRTVVAHTECEILYIYTNDFYAILKHYPNELSYLENCIDKLGKSYRNMYEEYAEKYKLYQTKLRDTVLNASRQNISTDFNTPNESLFRFLELTLLDPQSKFIGSWMSIRAVTVIVSISSTALQGGSGAPYREFLLVINTVCDGIAVVDIILKMFLGYYDKRGLLITGKLKCLMHYLSHGFILDVIGVLPVSTLLKMSGEHDDNFAMSLVTISKFAHLYLLTGYFDYVADTPIVNMTFIMILKWQVVAVLTMLGATHYFVQKCIEFHWNGSGGLARMVRRAGCWMPDYLPVDETPTVFQLHVVFAESLNLAESGLMRVNVGNFTVDRQNMGIGTVHFLLCFMFWYVMCYSLTLLVLNFRGNTIFQHGVSQLRQFLLAERVEKKVMDRAINHFRYWWRRTKGINMQNLLNERIGIVFRQDLSHYFFKKTFTALNTILQGGEIIERDLSSSVTELYFLPGEEIIREMDLVPCVNVVHRGRIVIKKNGQKITTLTKGCVFGQLSGYQPRPVYISAEAEGHADILQIPYTKFRDITANSEIKKHIDANPHSKDDYMKTDKIIVEDPYNTIKYILRGGKEIKLPWHNKPIKARSGSWYSHWLFVVWLLSPTVSTAITLIIKTVPPEFVRNIYWILILFDIVHFMNFISDFCTIELVVEKDRCLDRTLKWRVLKKWTCYADILSILLPLFELLHDNYNWGFARLIRLHVFIKFHKHFCTGFKSTAAPILLKVVIVCLMVHAMTCGWVYVACRDVFPVEVLAIPTDLKDMVDFSEWLHPNDRKGGCARITRVFYTDGQLHNTFLVPRDWKADYIVAMYNILIVYTHTELNSGVAVTLKQIYFKVLITFIIYLMYVWILSVTISAIYTKFRSLYRYDSSVMELLTYLDHNGLSPVLLKSVREYTKQLWQREKGNWLPELAHQAPQCLREDILSALYIHHFQVPPVFRDLPMYFIRQLVTRVQRVVIFPGKFIRHEGDIYSAMYFIHEGDVEKWQTDQSGENKMLSILTANGYFGLIPGLFPYEPFKFSYYSRTVVDLVVLRYKDWQDLLHGYPQIKQDLYAAVKQLK